MNKKQIACYLELFKVIKRSEMLDDKQKKELDTFLANLKGKYDKHRKKNKRLIDYVERLRAENKELHNKIDKAIEVLDDLLVYNDFKDITQGFGNVKEELKFYLSDYETLEEFRNHEKHKDLLKDSDVDE